MVKTGEWDVQHRLSCLYMAKHRVTLADGDIIAEILRGFGTEIIERQRGIKKLRCGKDAFRLEQRHHRPRKTPKFVGCQNPLAASKHIQKSYGRCFLPGVVGQGEQLESAEIPSAQGCLNILFIQLGGQIPGGIDVILPLFMDTALLCQLAHCLKIDGPHGAGIVRNAIRVGVDAVLTDLKRNNRDRCVGYGIGVVQCSIFRSAILTVLDTHRVTGSPERAEIILTGEKRVVKIGGEGVQPARVNGFDGGRDLLQQGKITQIFVPVGEKQKGWVVAVGAGNVQSFLQEIAAVSRVVTDLRHMYIAVEPKRHLNAEVEP